MSPQDATPPEWDANRLRIATDAAGVALWSWNVDTDEIAMDERAHGLWGVPEPAGWSRSRTCPPASIPKISTG